jgi:hypothetical protein
LEHKHSMLSSRLPSAQPLLRKQALLMESLQMLQLHGWHQPNLGRCRHLNELEVSAPVISQSTSFTLVLLLFVLGPFPINSGALPKGMRLHTLCNGSDWAHLRRKPKTEPNQAKPNRNVGFFSFSIYEVQSLVLALISMVNQTNKPRSWCYGIGSPSKPTFSNQRVRAAASMCSAKSLAQDGPYLSP